MQSRLIGLHKERIEKKLIAISNLHPSVKKYWHSDLILNEAESLLSTNDSTMKAVMGTSSALTRITDISRWWDALDD